MRAIKVTIVPVSIPLKSFVSSKMSLCPVLVVTSFAYPYKKWYEDVWLEVKGSRLPLKPHSSFAFPSSASLTLVHAYKDGRAEPKTLATISGGKVQVAPGAPVQVSSNGGLTFVGYDASGHHYDYQDHHYRHRHDDDDYGSYIKPASDVRTGGYSCPIMGQGCQNLAWGTSYETPWECENETNCSGFYPFPDGGSWTPPLYPFPGPHHGHGHGHNPCLRSAPCKHPVYLGRGVHTCQGPFANAVCDAAGGGWVWLPNGPSTIYNP